MPMDPADPRRRHVWVDVSGGGRSPGLIVAWRNGDDGWEGYVAVARDGAIHVTWEPATHLHPVSDDRWELPPGLRHR